jgi:hypothetical protein
MRYLLILLLIYLIYRFFRNIVVYAMRSHTRREDIPEEPPQPSKQNKIIEKDEGEYVDYEELKD